MTFCTVNGCSAKVEAKGLCNRHYLKQWRYGSPTAGREFARRGSGTLSKSHGYRLAYIEGKQVLEHIAIVEKAIGKHLPRGTQVHHVNGIKTDNRHENLVVCQNESYHKLLHRRQAALDATGDPNKRRCRYCGQWDFPQNLYSPPHRDTGYHRNCRQLNRKDY